MIQGEAGCMKQLKLWMFLIYFALGFDPSEGKKCVCWITPNFWKNALIAEKKFTVHWYKIFLQSPAVSHE